MPNVSKLLFFSTLITGTILVLSSETWLGMWMGLEMNMLSFIPIMFKSKKTSSAESCMIYFLVQSIGSILMLMLVLTNSSLMMLPYAADELVNIMLVFSMAIKLGMPPFHFWFPEIIKKMEWPEGLILMTWQKIAPMTILSYLFPETIIAPILIMSATIIGAIGGLNQTSIHKIMAFSSINHMGWMIACMKLNNSLWIMYLMIYSIILVMMVFIFNKYSVSYINQLTLSSNFAEKMLIIILFLSLGGLPPFLGFLPKWMVIQTMVISNTFPTLIIMILSSLITLFYYLRLISSNLLINSPTWKWNITSSSILQPKWSIFMIMLNLALPMILTFNF
uniref:NADH-ubiquinone oxidoreductase chain 2 n=1 Tax=Peirates lepturoides TaxID=1457305 RepID=A0A0C4K1E6_9HEMI|nr:NADH dehydrogenase subunit 2 [Peirates lepturoides]AHH93170.1 NADH dehydrogenase subunit 2 [Peirates lepturoides]